MASEAISDHALTIRSGTRGVAQRLNDGTLKPEERDDLDRARQILAFEEEGLTHRQMAHRLGMKTAALENAMRTQRYRLMRKYLAEQANLSEDEKSADERRQLRRDWDGLSRDALDYYRHALRRVGKSKEFAEPDRAERASLQIAKAQGWTDPLPTHVKPRDLQAGVIQGRMSSIAAVDRRETVVRITTTSDGQQTVEVGSRETAQMGDGG